MQPSEEGSIKIVLKIKKELYHADIIKAYYKVIIMGKI